MDKLKTYILEQYSKTIPQTTDWWKWKDYLKRVNMAEFKSVELSILTYNNGKTATLEKYKEEIYEDLAAPIKEEIKWYKEKNE